MNKKFIWLSAFVLALTFGQASIACGGNSKHCSAHHRFDKLASELELTPEQKEKINTYKEQARSSMKANYAQLKSLRGEISKLVQADKIDEAKLDSLVEQVNKIKGSMLKNRIMVQHEMYTLLTDKQKAKFQELKAKWQDRKKEKN